MKIFNFIKNLFSHKKATIIKCNGTMQIQMPDTKEWIDIGRPSSLEIKKKGFFHRRSKKVVNYSKDVFMFLFRK